MNNQLTAKVVTIANWFIKQGVKENTPISRIRLQKLMYFAWGEFWVFYKTHLFETDFYAWKYGPVIPELYEEAKNANSGHSFLLTNPIDHAECELSNIEMKSISRSYSKHKDKGEWDLVNLSHRGNDYKNTEQYQIMPKDRIKERFDTIDYIYEKFGKVFSELAKQ